MLFAKTRLKLFAAFASGEPPAPRWTSAQVRQHCGGVSDMSLWRWLNEGDFPRPKYVNRRRYWDSRAVANWWDARSDEAPRPAGAAARHIAA